VVDIKVLDPCGNKVVVRAAAAVPSGRQSVWLIGEHIHSGRLLKCEVYVDHIVRLDIATTTRTMYKGDVEMLEVYGFDQEGNQFSSLQGLEFEWTIRPNTTDLTSSSVSSLSSSSQSILKFVRFRESPIEVNDVVLRLEAEGKKTSVVLVQGIDTGKVCVTSRLLHYINPHLQQSSDASVLGDVSNIPPASVVISVREPLLLQPAYPIYILPHTTVQYTLYTYTRDALRPLDAFALQSYRWHTSNVTVAEVNSLTGLLRAKTLGFTHVIVQYVDLEESSAQSDVHVVDAAYLDIRISPKLDVKINQTTSSSTTSPVTSSLPFFSAAGHNQWCLIVNSTYLLEVEAYDNNHHKLYNTDELRFNVSLSSLYFFVVTHTENHARYEIIAFREGHTEISAAVIGFRVTLPHLIILFSLSLSLSCFCMR
jgi:nuclear pore complex protein Nup210